MSIESGLPEATAEGEKALFAVFWSLALALPTSSGLFQIVSEKPSDNSRMASPRTPKRPQNGAGSAVWANSVSPNAGARGRSNDLSDSLCSSALAVRLRSKPPQLVAPQGPTGLLSCRCAQATRKK